MERYLWFERHFTFGLSEKMLPFCLERLEGTIARIEAKVKNVPDSILSHQPGNKWSVKEIIGHLKEIDEVAISRVDEIIYGTSPISCAVFKIQQNYNAMPVEVIIRQFADVRMNCIARFKSIEEDELKRTSTHPRLKAKMTPVDLAWFDAEHDDHHLVRISEIINMFQTKSTFLPTGTN